MKCITVALNTFFCLQLQKIGKGHWATDLLTIPTPDYKEDAACIAAVSFYLFLQPHQHAWVHPIYAGQANS